MKTQQVCYDKREIERGVIKFVTNVKNEDSASAGLPGDLENLENLEKPGKRQK